MAHLARIQTGKVITMTSRNWWGWIILFTAVGVGVFSVFAATPKNSDSLDSLSLAAKNIYYCDTNSKYQTMDLYHPKESNRTITPVIIYIHGGGWNSGSKQNNFLRTYGPLFIKEGVSVAAIDYRLSPEDRFPDQNNDITCALRYLAHHAIELRIDIQKSLYVGESAGAELATFAALNPPDINSPYPAPLGVIDFYGVTDFSKIISGAHPDLNARKYLGANYTQRAAPASPITYIKNSSPPFLIFHGTADNIVPASQSKLLHERLTEVGVSSQLVLIRGAHHGFAGYESSKKDYEVIQQNMKAFIQRVLF
ncbi:MAG: lipase [Candidatus Saccharibacteria bacterium]|jgi:acetyl esterase/lipase|nr:lipase [Candidatus Saccharibacteria bacterium]